MSDEHTQIKQLEAACAEYREALRNIGSQVAFIDTQSGSLNANAKIAALDLIDTALDNPNPGETLLARVAELWEALDEYSGHRSGCIFWRYMDNPTVSHEICDCGLTALYQTREATQGQSAEGETNE